MSITRRDAIAGAVAGLAATTLARHAALAAQSYNWTFTAGHPPVFPWVKLADDFFLPEIKKRAAALPDPVTVDWRAAYGGTVAKIGAESDAIRDGISDAGLVATIFEAGTFPLRQYSLQVPFGTPSVQTQVSIVHRMLEAAPELDDNFTKNNIKPLSLICIDNYALITVNPVESFADLKGRKILAPGPVANWLRDTGAVAVAGNLNTYYNDLKTGVAEGCIVSLVPANNAKLYEVAPHVNICDLGAMSVGNTAFSLNVFEGLSPEMQQIVSNVGEEYEQRFAVQQDMLVEKSKTAMEQAGAKISIFPVEERRKWAAALPPLPKEWADKLEGQGLPARKVMQAYLDALKAETGELVRDWEL